MARTGIFTKDHPHYRWVALSNTTLGMLMATINSSIVIISLPAIFTGVKLNPLEPGNVSYLLWMLMGYMLVTAVLVVMFGRMGDQYGRVRIYNLGFVIFTVAAIALCLDPFSGGPGAMWLIAWRFVQGIGGAMLFANSTAILTDAFPANKRGFALGLNQVAAIAGSFIGLILGGVLAEIDWRAVFFVSVPFGIIGTIWSFKSLHEVGQKNPGRIDWLGNVTFAIGLIALLTGITYGIQPYGGSSQGWGNPWVLGSIIGGILLLIAFVVIELKVPSPMFDMRLFKIRAFSSGIFAGFLAAIGRGGLQFMLIIWLQGIWLPLHGYSYESTPLWAGIYMLPITIGFLIAGPISGALSDRFGSRAFSTVGLVLVAATFVGLLLIPVNFEYWQFALLTGLNGIGSGLFSSPNRTAIMNSVPANERGSASGMAGVALNAGSSLSIGIFFSLMIAGLSVALPTALSTGLTSHGVPQNVAAQIGATPPVGSLFAAFLGYNPIASLLGPTGLLQSPHVDAATLTGKEFFPQLISGPFHDGLVVVFIAAAVMSIIGAIASFLGGSKYVHEEAVAAARPVAVEGEEVGAGRA
ncbi:MFS transporter [Leifsonia shinshuensis]|uniref:MFS transporter n=1 Tax=Leifsonia shinshuensis TaxID=150026 RepID=A0A7G6YDU9_9MICO|nr:MFS transporter [Leifsonia shinshuensis]QNE36664.1 MFS transporter [Leifsonia shinshuensis]